MCETSTKIKANSLDIASALSALVKWFYFIVFMFICPENTSATQSNKVECTSFSFSRTIKEGTKASHKAAENVHFVRNFIRGKIEKALYKQLVADLYHVYRALEGKLDDFRDHALIKPIYFLVELRRLPSLERDMEFWFGEKWKSDIAVAKMTPCTREYVDRIEACDGERLLAHAYTRYLGDLSGGRILMQRARKSLASSLVKGSYRGLEFHVFEEITIANAFKDKFRNALDHLELKQSSAARIVKEANMAFLLNMRVFSELDVMTGDATELIDSRETSIEKVHVLQARAATELETTKSRCPFARMGKCMRLRNPLDHH